jgi:hypothetical protein
MESALLILQEKLLPLISREDYCVVHLVFTTLQHPEMLGRHSVCPRLIASQLCRPTIKASAFE